MAHSSRDVEASRAEAAERAARHRVSSLADGRLGAHPQAFGTVRSDGAFGVPHSCARCCASSLHSPAGQLRGRSSLPPELCARLPTRVALPAGIRISHVAAGTDHTIAVASSGVLYAFGRGQAGQLGHGNRKDLTTPTVPSGFLSALHAANVEADAEVSAVPAAEDLAKPAVDPSALHTTPLTYEAVHSESVSSSRTADVASRATPAAEEGLVQPGESTAEVSATTTTSSVQPVVCSVLSRW